MNKEQLKEKYGNEKVLCIYNKKLSTSKMSIDDLISYYGFTAYRFDVENDQNIRQIIPYVVIRYGDKIFCTTRIKGDERLVGRQSIGVGGHVDASDVSLFRSESMTAIDTKATVESCVIREINEELNFDWSDVQISYHGYFVDDSEPVSRVHLCLLYVIDVKNTNTTIKETDKLSGEFVSIDEAYNSLNKLENWSQIALKKLFHRNDEYVPPVKKNVTKKNNKK